MFLTTLYVIIGRMRPRAGSSSLDRRSKYAGTRRKKSRAGLFMLPVVLILLVVVFFLGSFIVGRVGAILLDSAPELAQLPMVGSGGDENAAVWKNKERVNILLLGTDRRPDESGPVRSDTILVASIDPVSKTGAMLGIPRDMWVKIPMDGGRWVEGKINTAHFYGDLYKYSGGGPGLAKKTVEDILGIKIQYVARVDFTPFQNMVDTLGGVNIDVQKPLKDDEYPTEDYGTKRIFFPAGLQHMDGEEALAYARSRHQDSDFGRMQRQQQVIVALRQQAMGLGMLPKLPALINQFKNMVYTDLAPTEALALAKLASDVDTTTITTRFLDESCCVTEILTTSGENALLPDPAAVKKVVSEIFATSQPTPQPSATRLAPNTKP